jgi:hypothetical protein
LNVLKSFTSMIIIILWAGNFTRIPVLKTEDSSVQKTNCDSKSSVINGFNSKDLKTCPFYLCHETRPTYDAILCNNNQSIFYYYIDLKTIR